VVVTPVGIPARSTTSGAFEKPDAEEDDAVASAAVASEYESVTTGTRVGFAGRAARIAPTGATTGTAWRAGTLSRANDA
jgi:hypothetical protein